MLLPLPPRKAQAVSLEYHLALSVLAAGRGGEVEAVRLLQAVWHVRFMVGSRSADTGLLDAAEGALDDIAARVDADMLWRVTDAEHAAIAQALVIHDRQTTNVPHHRFIAAWERMQQIGRDLERVSA